MWYKPKELTKYKGYGYEIAAMHFNPAAENFLKLRQGSSAHNAVIINSGI